MYIAMNRFKVKNNRINDFEQMWRSRDSYLNEVNGFISFKLLKGPERDDHVLYSSHTLWSGHDDFESWTKSEAFRKAHVNADNSPEPAIIGHPEFEGFEVVLHEENDNNSTASLSG